MSRRLALVIVTFSAALLAPPGARADRCRAGITNGPQCACPDFEALLADPNSRLRQNCPADWTPVIYDLGGAFAPDASIGKIVVKGGPRSPCSGFVTETPLRGQLVACWSAADNDGCRIFKVPFNGVCLEADSFTLGPPCTGTCDGLSSGILAIGNSGQGAGARVCPPVDPTVSCRSTSSPVIGTEIFRFQTGGLCATFGCDGTTPGENACIGGWGASYFGFGNKGGPPGHYDWQSGGFKVVLVGHRARCGVFRDCLGRRGNPWEVTVVGNPAASYVPPCPAADLGSCIPVSCFP